LWKIFYTQTSREAILSCYSWKPFGTRGSAPKTARGLSASSQKTHPHTCDNNHGPKNQHARGRFLILLTVGNRNSKFKKKYTCVQKHCRIMWNCCNMYGWTNMEL